MLLLAAPAVAQTPDGQTPAEETVCDPLMAGGVTKGLYGLCVAFCEAQDHVSVGTPITEAELEMLADAAPSRRILANYNKKKQATDPPMPCILVEEPCPCWSNAELESIEGLAPNNDIINLLCTDFTSNFRLIFTQEGPPIQIALTFQTANQFICAYENTQTVPSISRNLSTSQNTLTFAEGAICADQLLSHCDALGF